MNYLLFERVLQNCDLARTKRFGFLLSFPKFLAVFCACRKIRPCPSINPGCLSTNPKSSNFTFPWSILGNTSDSAAIQQQLKDAILKTQKNVKIQLVADTPNVGENTGKYLQAEVDGGFGRDVLEFLVNKDVVSFRAMATKVTYVYPFTTAFGDSKGQEARLKQIIDELGWYAPSFEYMD